MGDSSDKEMGNKRLDELFQLVMEKRPDHKHACINVQVDPSLIIDFITSLEYRYRYINTTSLPLDDGLQDTSVVTRIASY